MRKRLFSIVCVVLFLVGCGGEANAKVTGDCGLYVWSDFSAGDLIETMNKCDAREAYLATEGLSQTPTAKDIKTHKRTVRKLSKAGAQVYYLCGDSMWGMDPEGTAIVQTVEAVAEYNSYASEEERFAGIQFDIEPYTFATWSEDTWYSAMKAGKDRADELGIKISVCLPYWLEGEFLEKIMSCGDEIFIMDYYQGLEVDNIKEEWTIAQETGKRLVCVINAEDYDSFEEINRVLNRVEIAYPGIGLAYHSAETLKEMYK